jgi:uncharacterized protein YndB with AHSA1/START domain
MSTRSVKHGSFTLERLYDASPAVTFGAWSNAEAKRTWWGPPDDAEMTHQMDFRVGGLESSVMSGHAGARWTFDAQYHDIVENERIVFSYQMTRDYQLASVSVTVVQLTPHGAGTKLTLTEYDVFLDGIDEMAERKQGTALLLESLAKALDEGKVSAV